MAAPTPAKTTRVLVVTTEEDLRKNVEALLAKAGLEVTALGSEADAMAQAVKLDPDMIITDVALPDGSGTALARKLRKQVRWEKVPMLFLTARTPLELSDLRKDTRAADWVTKPVDPRALSQMVKARLTEIGRWSPSAIAPSAPVAGDAEKLRESGSRPRQPTGPVATAANRTPPPVTLSTRPPTGSIRLRDDKAPSPVTLSKRPPTGSPRIRDDKAPEPVTSSPRRPPTGSTAPGDRTPAPAELSGRPTGQLTAPTNGAAKARATTGALAVPAKPAVDATDDHNAKVRATAAKRRLRRPAFVPRLGRRAQLAALAMSLAVLAVVSGMQFRRWRADHAPPRPEPLVRLTAADLFPFPGAARATLVAGTLRLFAREEVFDALEPAERIAAMEQLVTRLGPKGAERVSVYDLTGRVLGRVGYGNAEVFGGAAPGGPVQPNEAAGAASPPASAAPATPASAAPSPSPPVAPAGPNRPADPAR